MQQQISPHCGLRETSRRDFVRAAAGAIGTAIVAPAALAQQTNANLGTPPSVITNPRPASGTDMRRRRSTPIPT